MAFGYMMWGKGEAHERDYLVSGRLYEKLKQEFSKAMKYWQTGEGNSQYGKIWVYNPQAKQNKKILKSESVPDGWLKGRVLNWENYEKQIKVLERKL